MATNTTSCPSGCYATTVLRNLERQFQEQQLCDVSLVVGDRVFHAHRTVLAASSPYFHAMFTGNLAEKAQSEIPLDGVSPDVFSKLLQFIYSGCVNVTENTCQDLLAAADLYDVAHVVEGCCSFLKQALEPSNCIGIYLFADVHSCLELKQECHNFITSHMSEVVKEEEFMTLSKDTVIHFLQGEDIRVENELEVFRAAVRWINFDLKSRRSHVFNVLAPVRIPVIPQRQLEKFIDSCTDLSLKIAMKKLAQDFWRTGHQQLCSKSTADLLQPHLFQPRKGASKKLYVVGGYNREKGGRWSDNQTLDVMECFDSFANHWEVLPSLHHSRSGLGVAVIDGLVYAIGGESDSLILDTAECFDPSSGTWTLLPCMTVPRCGLGVCVLEKRIYAVGGWIGSEIGGTVEMLNPQFNCWKNVGRMRTPRFCLGAIAYEGLIYILGGLSELGMELGTLESYNPVTQEWLNLAPCHIPRAYTGLVVCDGCLYAVGGWNEDHGALDSVERYHIEKNSWEFVSSLTQARAGAAVAGLSGYIYAIGGRTSSSDVSAPYTLDSVECYDPQTDSWFNVACMPTGRCESGVAVV